MILNTLESNKKYGIIYTDPPWQQTKGNLRKCRPNQGKTLDYQTMDLQSIMEHQKQAYTMADDKCNIFMWTIDKFIRDVEEEMTRGGIAYTQGLCGIKQMESHRHLQYGFHMSICYGFIKKAIYLCQDRKHAENTRLFLENRQQNTARSLSACMKCWKICFQKSINWRCTHEHPEKDGIALETNWR